MPGFREGVEEIYGMAEITVFNNWQYALLAFGIFIGAFIVAKIFYYISIAILFGCRRRNENARHRSRNVGHLIIVAVTWIILLGGIVMALQTIGVDPLTQSFGFLILGFILNNAMGDWLQNKGALFQILITSKVEEGMYVKFRNEGTEGYVERINDNWVDLVPTKDDLFSAWNGKRVTRTEVPLVNFIRRNIDTKPGLRKRQRRRIATTTKPYLPYFLCRFVGGC